MTSRSGSLSANLQTEESRSVSQDGKPALALNHCLPAAGIADRPGDVHDIVEAFLRHRVKNAVGIQLGKALGIRRKRRYAALRAVHYGRSEAWVA